MGDRIARKRPRQVRKQQSHTFDVQKQAMVEEQHETGNGQGALAAVLSSEQADRVWAVSVKQGTCFGAGRAHGSTGYGRLHRQYFNAQERERERGADVAKRPLHPQHAGHFESG